MPIFQLRIVKRELFERRSAADRVIHLEIDGLLEFQRGFRRVRSLDQRLGLGQRLLVLTPIHHLTGNKKPRIGIEIVAQLGGVFGHLGLVLHLVGNRERLLQVLVLIALIGSNHLLDFGEGRGKILGGNRIGDDHLVNLRYKRRRLPGPGVGGFCLRQSFRETARFSVRLGAVDRLDEFLVLERDAPRLGGVGGRG